MGELFGIPSSSLGTLNVLDGTASPARVIWQVNLEGQKPEAKPLEVLSRNGGSGEASLGDSGEGSLRVIPAGGALRTQSDLKLERLPALLAEMRKRADFVLL